MESLSDLHGWVLSRQTQGNTSLILKLFTLEKGRIDVMAKGGRKNPLLQPFRPLWLHVGGRGRLPLLHRVEATGRALTFKGDALWCAFYLNELLMRLLSGSEASVSLFSSYGHALEAMLDTTLLQPVLRQFECQLLAECGYGLDLHQDVAGEALSADHYYQLTATGLEKSTEGFSGVHLLAWLAGEWDRDIARTSRNLMRVALRQHLGGKPLKSREMMLSLQAGKH